MPLVRRLSLFAAAIVIAILPEVFLVGRASHAGDDCLSKPNAAAPQGSHWYYRVDRATRRECWYLGAERKVRPQASSDALPVQPPISKKGTQPAPQSPVRPSTAEVVFTQAAPALNAPLEPMPQATESDDNSTETSSLPRFDLSTQTASLDPGQPVARRGYAEEQPATARAQDEMPLIWPVLTPVDQAAAGRRPEFTVSFPQLGAFLTAVLGLAIIVGRVIFKLSTRRRNHSREREQRGATRHAGRRGAGISTNTTAASRAARMAPSPNDPALDYEARVRRLLHELQRRQHKERRDSKWTTLERAGLA